MTAMQTIRTSVSPEVFAELDHRAEQQGLTLAAYVRTVLTEHVADHRTPQWQPTPPQWADFRAWVLARPGVLFQYEGSRHWARPEDRAAVIRWAIEEKGYDPTP